MHAPLLISLILIGAVFLIWAVSMFQMLWAMWQIARARSAALGGGMIQDTLHRWHAFLDFWRRPECRRLKWRVVILSVVVMAMSIARAYIVADAMK